MNTEDNQTTTAPDSAAEGAGNSPSPAPSGVPEIATVATDSDAISNESIMYGDTDAASERAPEQNPYIQLLPEDDEDDAERPIRESPYAPITMDLIAPRRVDVMIGHGSYEMRTLEEFGSATKTRFFQLWNQSEEIGVGVRGVLPEPVPDPLHPNGKPFNHQEIADAQKLIDLWGSDLGKSDAQLDDIFRRILELAMPNLPKKLLRGRTEKGRLTSAQVQTLVNRFLVLIGEEPVVLESVSRTPNNVRTLPTNR